MSNKSHSVFDSWPAALAIVAATTAAGCTLNGKPIGFPGKGGEAGGREASTSESGGSGGGVEGGGEVATPVSSERPGWCDVEGAADLDPGGVEYTLDEDDVRDQVHDLTAHFCAERPTTERRDELVALHGKLSKQLLMNDGDWKDAVEWALASPPGRSPPSMLADKRIALSKLDGIDQYLALSQAHTGVDYLADELDPELTALGRMGYVDRCLNDEKVGQWAICHADVLALDPERISEELRASTHRSGYERIAVRIEMNRVRTAIAKRVDAVKALVAKDPGYEKLFAVAAEAHASWKPDPSYASMAFAMADATRANSRSAFAGCGDSTWTAFSSAVAGRFPAKRFSEIVASVDRSFGARAVSIMLDDADVYLAAYALIRCAQGSDGDPDFLVRTLSDAMMWSPGLRGPRTAAHTALLAAGIQLDDRAARIDYPDTHRDFPGSSSSGGGGHGEVAKVEEGTSGVTIGFTKIVATYEECTKWKTTNRIDRIDEYGNLHYEELCTKWKTAKYDAASPPQTVAPRYVTRVAKGTNVDTAEDVVVVVRSNNGDDVLAVFGIAVD